MKKGRKTGPKRKPKFDAQPNCYTSDRQIATFFEKGKGKPRKRKNRETLWGDD